MPEEFPTQDPNLPLEATGEVLSAWEQLSDNSAMTSYYVDPEETAIIRETDGMAPIDPQELADWLNQLTPEARNLLEKIKTEERQRQAGHAEASSTAHSKLTELVPELYEAQLPEVLANRLGDTPYVLGFNQTMASTVQEARDYVAEEGGIDFTGYRLSQRFLMYDQSMTDYLGTEENPMGISAAIELGYFGEPTIGRFVVAFPAEHSLEASKDPLAIQVDQAPGHVLSADAITLNNGKQVVSGRYVAGFIDEAGDFWLNNNFAEQAEPAFSRYQKEPTDLETVAP